MRPAVSTAGLCFVIINYVYLSKQKLKHMINSITSKAGLIGYYEGSIKSIINTLKSIPENKRSWEVKTAIQTLEVILKDGAELWDKVKGN